MRHPFEGIMTHEGHHGRPDPPPGAPLQKSGVESRRSMIRLASAGFVGATAFLFGRRLFGQGTGDSLSLETLPQPGAGREGRQDPPTLAYGEEGDARARTESQSGRQRRRRDDSYDRDPGEDRYTTQALGEEGGGEERGRIDREWETRDLDDLEDRYTPRGRREEEPRPRRGNAGQDRDAAQLPGEDRSRDRTGQRDDTYTTQALGEEGGRLERGDDRYTTQALGEEGGRDDRYTTQALGEEGGRGDDRYTTQALGEEGARGDGRFTTQALGEEGGYWPDERQRYTTQALGEEGSWAPPPPQPPRPYDPPRRGRRLRERVRNWTGRLLGR